MFLWVRYPNIFFWVVNQKTLCAFSSKLVSCSVSGILLFRLAAVSAFSPPCFLKRPLAPFAAILNGTLARFYPEYQVDKLCTVRPLATWTALGVVTRPLVSGDFNHVDCVLCTALLCIIVNFAKCTFWIVVNWAPFEFELCDETEVSLVVALSASWLLLNTCEYLQRTPNTI